MAQRHLVQCIKCKQVYAAKVSEAGGEIPLGIFADYTTDGPDLLAIVEQIVTARLVDELQLSEAAEERPKISDPR